MFEESMSEIPSSIWALINQWFTPAVFFVLLNLMIATIAFTSTFANKKQNQQNEPKIDGSSPSVPSQDPQNSTIYKQAPDSDTHFNPEHSQNLETQPHCFFQENNFQDPQILSIHEKTPDSDTLLNPEQSRNLETQSHCFSQENLQISQSRASNSSFQQTHEQDPQETQTHFVLEREDTNLDDFEQALEEEVEENYPAQSMDQDYSQLTGGHLSRTKSETEPSCGEVPVKVPARMRKSASLKSAFGHFEEEKIVEARRQATVREKKGNAGATEGDEEVDAKADDFISKFRQQLKLQRLDSILRCKRI